MSPEPPLSQRPRDAGRREESHQVGACSIKRERQQRGETRTKIERKETLKINKICTFVVALATFQNSARIPVPGPMTRGLKELLCFMFGTIVRPLENA